MRWRKIKQKNPHRAYNQQIDRKIRCSIITVSLIIVVLFLSGCPIGLFSPLLFFSIISITRLSLPFHYFLSPFPPFHYFPLLSSPFLSPVFHYSVPFISFTSLHLPKRSHHLYFSLLFSPSHFSFFLSLLSSLFPYILSSFFLLSLFYTFILFPTCLISSLLLSYALFSLRLE